MRKIAPLYLLVLLWLPALSQNFSVSYSPAAFSKPFTGKLLIFLDKENKHPKDGAVDIVPFPCFSVDVLNLQPGAPVIVNDKAVSYPVKLSDLERGDYYVQAVWDRNLGGRAIAESPGNIYSKTIRVSFTKDTNKSFKLVADQVIPEQSFRETDFVKQLKVSSALLSAFHRKPMTMEAAVILPAGYYDSPDKKYPVQFIVSGYGGDYHRYSGDTVARSQPIDSFPCITVYLDGNCALGHSVYANSANNGPWGDALTTELIPFVESKYHCNGARLLRGHSSGGWTVLWLQTHYPALFAACWSSSPDPVDFRSFQRINLYEGDNLFYGKDSSLRSVATVAGAYPWASQKQAIQQELVVYRGEQMHSFDAVFGDKGADGNPLRLCNPVTGELDKKTFEHWKQYDICLYLRNNWPALKPDLQGKIRVSVGEQDNFLLNDAVHILDGEMKKLDTGFQFGYYPGDHFTVSTAEYRKAGMHFLADRYQEWTKLQGK